MIFSRNVKILLLIIAIVIIIPLLLIAFPRPICDVFGEQLRADCEEREKICEAIGVNDLRSCIGLELVKKDIEATKKLCSSQGANDNEQKMCLAESLSSIDEKAAADECNLIKDDSLKNYCLALVLIHNNKKEPALNQCSLINETSLRETCIAKITS